MLNRRSPATFAGALAYQHTDIPPRLTLEQWRQRKRAQRLCERPRGMVGHIWARKARRAEARRAWRRGTNRVHSPTPPRRSPALLGCRPFEVRAKCSPRFSWPSLEVCWSLPTPATSVEDHRIWRDRPSGSNRMRHKGHAGGPTVGER